MNTSNEDEDLIWTCPVQLAKCLIQCKIFRSIFQRNRNQILSVQYTIFIFLTVLHN
jgi:hypothetical protein